MIVSLLDMFSKNQDALSTSVRRLDGLQNDSETRDEGFNSE